MDQRFKVAFAKDLFKVLIDPRSTKATDASYPKRDDDVIGITLAGESKAYPIKLVSWHHVINDRLGGENIAVTFCPQCGSGEVFDCTLEGRRVIFRVAGVDIDRANSVLYDEESLSLWSQILGECVWGKWHGTRLFMVPFVHTTWSKWKEMYPESTVLSRETGYKIDYDQYRKPVVGKTPYEEFLKSPEIELSQYMSPDPRFHPKELVLGIRMGNVARAYPFCVLQASQVVNDIIGNEPILVVFDPWTRTAEVFHRVVKGQIMTFRENNSEFVDDISNSRWDLMGRATSGPNLGSTLKRLHSFRGFWYAWAAAFPSTEIFSSDGGS